MAKLSIRSRVKENCENLLVENMLKKFKLFSKALH
jgi:hypothetical protein